MTSTFAPAVYFLGAGPGDPDLLTLRGHKLLAQADLILYANSLVPQQMLEVVKPTAQCVPTGNKTLEEIIPLMVRAVEARQVVVRLHSGDLSLYSAIQEQIQRLQQAQIPVECVPGISAFQGLAARLNTELTLPELVQTIILTRLSGEASPVPAAENLASLAAHQASLGLYLAARQVETAQAQLLSHYPAHTGVAIAFRLGWPDEKIWLVPLAQMAALSRQENLIRTTLYLISPALNRFIDPHSHQTQGRSQLYHPQHHHLFRPR
jgi:precorrin-4/cobalt-precorrin-4 C11-methyltransferase